MAARHFPVFTTSFFLMLVALSAPALTEGPYTYEISNGEATITEFDRYFSGALAITNTLGGCPVTAIRENAFFEHAISAVIIPETVTRIGAGPFVDCGNLTNISVKAENPSYSATNGVLFDKHYTTLIQYPPELKGGYEVPFGVTTINDDAFQACFHLTEVTIPLTVTSIGDRAFWACFAVTNISFSSGLIRIGDLAFGLTSTTSLTIPDTVTDIGEQAFYCSDLTKVTIGRGVANIGSWAFCDCPFLTNVFFKGNAPDLGDSVFDFISLIAVSSATVYYLLGTTGWSTTFGGLPTLLWNPIVQPDANFGFASGLFGFNIAGTTNIPVRVEATTNLASDVWLQVTNANLGAAGTMAVNDPDSSAYPSRFYRIVFP